ATRCWGLRRRIAPRRWSRRGCWCRLRLRSVCGCRWACCRTSLRRGSWHSRGPLGGVLLGLGGDDLRGGDGQGLLGGQDLDGLDLLTGVAEPVGAGEVLGGGVHGVSP